MSARNPQIRKLISIIEPVLEASGFELVELRFLMDQGGWTLRVCVDMPLDPSVPPSEVPADRVDLSDCEQVSRELSAVLDVDDPIPQAYSLEVSSPGIERPLRTAKHYEYFAGSEAKIQMAVGVSTKPGPKMEGPGFTPGPGTDAGSERKNFRGVIRGVEAGHVLLEADGQTYKLDIDDIDHAKLIPDWDAVMKGGRGVGAPPPKPAKPGGKVAKNSKAAGAAGAAGAPKKTKQSSSSGQN